MTTDTPTTVHRRPAPRPPTGSGPAAGAPSAAPAAAVGRAHRRSRGASARPARAGSSRRSSCSSGRSSPYQQRLGAARHRPGRLRDPAADRAPAHRLAHRRRWTGSTASGRAGRSRVVGVRADRRAHGVPAVASPVHVPRRHPRDRARRRHALPRVRAPAAVRRHDHRSLGGLLVPGGARRGRRDRPRSGSPTRSSSPGGRGRSPRSVGAGDRARLRAPPSSTSGPTTRSTSSVGAQPRGRDPASTRSASSRRTRSFPVAYRQGKTAHLDVGGQRGEAIRQAVQDQLGLTVVDIKPVGLAGSGGSTPLRLTRRGRPRHLPVREALRDEPRARRPLVQARPHASSTAGSRTRRRSSRCAGSSSTRTTRCASCATSGIPTATPYGIVEMTPEREYLLVTEFFDGAEEIGDAEVDDDIIDEGLAARSASCGTPGSRTATSSRPTCSCATARCCSSTSPSCRCARRRGARRSTSPT